MVDTKTRLNSIVNSILGVYSDLQTNTRRCKECNAVATYCNYRSVYADDRRLPKVFYCKEHVIELGVDYEEDDEEDDEDYGDGYDEDYNFTKE